MLQLEHHQLERRYDGLRVEDLQRHRRLLASLAAHGQQNPVLVIAGESAGQYILIDGYIRSALLEDLGIDLVLAVQLDLEEAEALILAHRLDARRTRSALEEGWFIAELIARHGLTQQDIAERLSRSSSWVCRRLALVEKLPAVAQNAVRAGTIPAQAAMKSLVPLARANRTHCQRLVQAIGRTPISVRQVDTLYRAWRQADDTVRDRIVNDPWLLLKTMSAAEPERVPEDDPAAPLLGDLEGISGLAHRAKRRLREGIVDELDHPRRQRVRRALKDAQHAFRVTYDLLEAECSTETHAQPS